MKTKIYLAMTHGVAVIGGSNGRWLAEVRLENQPAQCLAVDANRKERVYCGSFEKGLFRSDDTGDRWAPCTPLGEPRVTSLAVAYRGADGQPALLYAGTEPSAIYQSRDGGETWQALSGLRDLPSAGEWSFPPRPETHHVRYMLFDPYFRGRLHVAVEAGA